MSVGGKKVSKTLVREKIKDFFKGRLSFEEVIEIQEAYKSVYGVLVDRSALAPFYLVRYSIGYSPEEIAQMVGSTTQDVQEVLLFTFAVLGEVLQLDDAMIVRKLDKPLRIAAQDVLNKIYLTFTEVE
jgi:hypothetical protein